MDEPTDKEVLDRAKADLLAEGHHGLEWDATFRAGNEAGRGKAAIGLEEQARRLKKARDDMRRERGLR